MSELLTIDAGLHTRLGSAKRMRSHS